jgi:hypothetical protein
MDAPEDRSKALNEHMSSGFASRADIVAVCRYVRFVPQATHEPQQTTLGWHLGKSALCQQTRDSAYRSGRSPDWLKMKNPACAAVKREAEEDWGKERWR